MSERKLATIRKIDKISPIEGADRIERVTIGGWNVVSQKDLYKEGDLVIYCEIDSFIPTEIAPFLTQEGQNPKEYNGVRGERLRSKKLRGVVSQGLLLPLTCIRNEDISVLNGPYPIIDGLNDMLFVLGKEEGEKEISKIDFTELLGIQKYEAPIPACLAGEVIGMFPSFIPKTDEERCLSGDTLIEVEGNEFRTIQHICENNIRCKVKSYNVKSHSVEWKGITDFSIMRRSSNWYEIETKTGKKLQATGNHRVWCSDINSYRLVSDLSVGQKVIITNI